MVEAELARSADRSLGCMFLSRRETDADIRNAWRSNWNTKQLDNVIKLYATNATYLSSDGSRISGQDNIRAYMQKPIGSKDSVQSVTLDCSGDIVDDSGT
jgi:ketosteroid isomerase-like protein